MTSDAARLVTLTGPGGVGKTRLAIEAAIRMAESFPEGVAFVPLAHVSDEHLVIPAIARAFQLNPVSGQDVEATLVATLGTARCLIVIDNFEQVMDAAPVVARLMDDLPQVRFLVTSRSPLRLGGEREYPLSPLTLRTGDESARDGAVALFVERAKAVDPSFALTPRNLPTLVRICERLDGLPLAIELAAPRLKMLRPEALLDLLDQRLTVLSSGMRDAPKRQQTLRDAIGWSYDLLEPRARTLFRRLAVFAGGFSLDAAEAVVTALDGGADGVFDGVSELIDQSLLRRQDSGDGDSRIGMLHTIRMYALDALVESGEFQAVRAAHADYYRERLAKAVQTLKTPAQVSWAAWFVHEIDNLIVAIETLIDRGDKVGAIGCAADFSRLWAGRIALGQLDDLIDRAFALEGDLPPDLEFDGQFAKAWVATFSGDNATAAEVAGRTLAIAYETGRPADVVKARNLLGGIAFHSGDVDGASAHFEGALRIAQELDDSRHLEALYSNLGLIAQIRQDAPRAVELHERSLDLAVKRGDQILIAISRLHLGHLAVESGDLLTGWNAVREVLPVTWTLRHLMGVAETLWLEADVAEYLGDSEYALRCAAVAFGLSEGAGVGNTNVVTKFSQRIDAMREILVARGQQRFVSPHDEEIAAIVAEVMARPAPSSVGAPVPVDDDSGLTPREIEIVRLIAQGRTNQEIADQLYISLRTVQTHVSNILPKLGLTSRSAVAAFAVRTGLA